MIRTWILMLLAFKSCRISAFLKAPFSNSRLKLTMMNVPRNITRNGPVDEKTVVIIYNKPKGVITSHISDDDTTKNSPAKRITVYEDVMSMKGYIPLSSSNFDQISSPKKSFPEITGIYSKLHAIGRLDADTTGLLLLTNDGGLVHHVTNPSASTSKSRKIVKTYEAIIMGYHELDQTDESDSSKSRLKELLNGVDIGEKYGGLTLPPIELKVIGHPTPKSTQVLISISEGRNRQVRRMFHAINSGVIHLRRNRIGKIDLDMLGGDVGSWRILSDEEILLGLEWKVRVLREDHVIKPPSKSDRLKKQLKQTKKTKTR